jgi:hypothetical protein
MWPSASNNTPRLHHVGHSTNTLQRLLPSFCSARGRAKAAFHCIPAGASCLKTSHLLVRVSCIAILCPGVVHLRGTTRMFKRVLGWIFASAGRTARCKAHVIRKYVGASGREDKIFCSYSDKTFDLGTPIRFAFMGCTSSGNVRARSKGCSFLISRPLLRFTTVLMLRPTGRHCRIPPFSARGFHSYNRLV